ncbi:GNAT family N-acetyltransferase [Comamonas testosteroni]|uniref:Putative acyltransferase n=1 Tax=Comamonas testosteroni TaxID=285 RepID=A0A8B4S1B9_COMTE|nr:GNAT family N-acetyltransferase [Comamonas testosteroni]EHN64404.1 putative acetyltransferase [Comamonas testosteroni ATCC 11996]QQN69712.1 GNAT family N-acetyltransferase [Comamonas testosteroni]SUY76631.1 putative acyltransferase [Comamonas testosteroni]
MHVRSYRPGDEIALWQVFHDAVHQLAVNHYSQVQLDAWAPQQPDWTQWRQRIQALQPFVAVGDNDQAMAYADLQANGYIDHFFVAPQYARQGVGRRLLAHIEQTARQNGLHELSADVSLNAQAFFIHFGFELQRQQTPVVHGIALSNARMRKTL